MEIEIISDKSKLECTEYVIRKLDSFDEDSGEYKSGDHFQANIRDWRNKKDSSVDLNIRYEDENGDFLGFDEGSIYGSTKKEFSTSIAMTIPDKTTKIKIKIEERDFGSFSSNSDLIFFGVVVVAVGFLMVFAAKGIFGWT